MNPIDTKERPRVTAATESPPRREAQVRFCVPGTRSPYIEIDGVKFHVGERTDGDSELATILGHQGKEFTERDFILLLWLALEADRLGVEDLEVSCQAIAGKPAWHSDWRQVRTGVARRFSGPVRAQKQHVIWEPRARFGFDDKERCREYAEGPGGAAAPAPPVSASEPPATSERLRDVLHHAETLVEQLRATLASLAPDRDDR